MARPEGSGDDDMEDTNWDRMRVDWSAADMLAAGLLEGWMLLEFDLWGGGEEEEEEEVKG